MNFIQEWGAGNSNNQGVVAISLGSFFYFMLCLCSFFVCYMLYVYVFVIFGFLFFYFLFWRSQGRIAMPS